MSSLQLSSTSSGSGEKKDEKKDEKKGEKKGDKKDGGMSSGGGAEVGQKRKGQSACSFTEEEEMYCGHIVQPRVPNEVGREEVSPDCPCCKVRQQLPLDKKLAAEQIADKEKAREDLLEQLACLEVDLAELKEYERARGQEIKDVRKVVFRLQREQEAWDEEQAKLPDEQHMKRNFFDEELESQLRNANEELRLMRQQTIRLRTVRQAIERLNGNPMLPPTGNCEVTESEDTGEESKEVEEESPETEQESKEAGERSKETKQAFSQTEESKEKEQESEETEESKGQDFEEKERGSGEKERGSGEKERGSGEKEQEFEETESPRRVSLTPKTPSKDCSTPVFAYEGAGFQGN
ncbi:hypothetical protein KC315_g862 [Hortaea werneckii]|nr:hypothetical protein KC315_g862 [Hortaea werneckii]